MSKGKIFKIAFYLWVPICTSLFTKDNVREQIQKLGFIRHLHIDEGTTDEISEISESPLFHENCDLAECEKFFSEKPTSENGREVKAGERYRHFKGHTVEVLTVAQDTEHPGSYSVVYRCLDNNNLGKIWHRPYSMFASKVDRVKYPDVAQEYRFEKIDG